MTDGTVHAVFQFKIKTDLPLIAKQGTKGYQIGEFNNPRNLAVSKIGDLYGADYSNNRVQIFSSSLLHLRNLTEQLSQPPVTSN